MLIFFGLFFFSSRRRHTRWPRDWSSDVCSSDLKSGRRQARVRIRLLDGTATEISRRRKTAQEARLAVQSEIDVLLTMSKGSEELKPDDKIGKAARQWINELRVRSRWPNAPVRPQ